MSSSTQKPDENPRPVPAGAQPEDIKDRGRLNQVEYIQQAKSEITGKTKQGLFGLRKDVLDNTEDARAGADRPGYIHRSWTDAAEPQFKAIEEKAKRELDALLPKGELTIAQHAELLLKIEAVKEKHAQDVTRYQQALIYAVKALAGTNRKIEREDYAYFATIMNNINVLFSKDVKIADVIMRIQGDTIQEQDWKVICGYLIKYPYFKDVSTDRDKVNLNVTAFFIQLMDQNQRYRAVLKFYEYTNKDEKKTTEFMDALAGAGVIHIKQREQLISEIRGKKYITPPEEEKRLLEQQALTVRINQEIRKKLGSPMYVNGFERFATGKGILAFAGTLVGGLGMFMNYWSHFTASKGMLNRALLPLSKKYFLLSGALMAGSVNWLTALARPGESVGALKGFRDTLFPKVERLDNPFGVGPDAELKDSQFTLLSQICANYKNIEIYLMKTKGFEDIHGFLAERDFDMKQMQKEAEVKEKPEKGKEPKMRSVYDHYMDFIENKTKNKEGKKLLLAVEKSYGRTVLMSILFRLFTAVNKIGILNKAQFKDKIPGQTYSYNDLYQHRTGVKSLTQPQIQNKKIKK